MSSKLGQLFVFFALLAIGFNLSPAERQDGILDINEEQPSIQSEYQGSQPAFPSDFERVSERCEDESFLSDLLQVHLLKSPFCIVLRFVAAELDPLHSDIPPPVLT